MQINFVVMNVEKREVNGMIKEEMLFQIIKKLDFLIWKYGGTVSKCPEPQLLLEAFQRDLDELKDGLTIKK